MKLLRNIFKLRPFRESFSYALQGLGYLVLYHRNMRVIFLSGLLAIVAGLYFQLKGIELVALCITVTMVFIAEIFNTAIELLMDMVNTQYHAMIKVIKDISAAVVLIATLNALAVGFILFAKKVF
ncbi:MAG: diacylglycerol kinase family protein [Candidatus Omnitrophota bacterium]|jgi:diacylglycerol kinase (ATP)|nr:MAG: diacylglycerol kinase family protein [Candidatus Omnitrophota bacterium]